MIRFHRRLKLFKGLGLNIGKRSVGASVRGRKGSISIKGISLRTPILGLSIRLSWKQIGFGILTLILVLGKLLSNNPII